MQYFITCAFYLMAAALFGLPLATIFLLIYLLTVLVLWGVGTLAGTAASTFDRLLLVKSYLYFFCLFAAILAVGVLLLSLKIEDTSMLAKVRHLRAQLEDVDESQYWLLLSIIPVLILGQAWLLKWQLLLPGIKALLMSVADFAAEILLLGLVVLVFTLLPLSVTQNISEWVRDEIRGGRIEKIIPSAYHPADEYLRDPIYDGLTPEEKQAEVQRRVREHQQQQYDQQFEHIKDKQRKERAARTRADR